MMHRRNLIGALAAGLAGLALTGQRAIALSAANQWYPLRGDDGHPVPNLRAPIELVTEIEDLPGILWGGGGSSPAVTLVEFYDYNCPWCRAAASDLASLMHDNGDLRIGLVNNAILSSGSIQAAKVHLAVMRVAGPKVAHDLHERLFKTSGRIDGTKALDAAAALGTDRAEIERVADADETRLLLRRQMGLAASLGLMATPSFVVGGAALLGYPGPRSLAGAVAETRSCGTVTCQSGG